MHDFFSALINHKMIKSPKFLGTGTRQVKMVDKGTEQYNHSIPKGPSAADYLALTREGSLPDCFVEELGDKGAEESIFFMQCKRLPPLQITRTHPRGLRSRLLVPVLTQEGSTPDHIILTQEGSTPDY
jgi:hypothetical protein